MALMVLNHSPSLAPPYLTELTHVFAPDHSTASVEWQGASGHRLKEGRMDGRTDSGGGRMDGEGERGSLSLPATEKMVNINC